METLRVQLLNTTSNLKSGDYLTEMGRCYYCGQIEPTTDGEAHPYFTEDGKFLSKECYATLKAIEIDTSLQTGNNKVIRIHVSNL